MKSKAEDPLGFQKLQADLLPIIQRMPHAAQRMRAAHKPGGSANYCRVTVMVCRSTTSVIRQP